MKNGTDIHEICIGTGHVVENLFWLEGIKSEEKIWFLQVKQA